MGTGRRAVALAAANAGGLLAGAVLDRVLGDPRRYHPVAGFGRAAGAWERRVYRSDLRSGALFTGVAVGAPVVLGTVALLATRRHPWLRAGLTAGATWAVLGGTSLRREARAMADSLAGQDLDAARDRLPHLCGRDPSGLGTPELARATVESVAENSSDAEVAPLFWGAAAGLPGLLGYRAVNTLDAMVGHRSPRYHRFGTPAARLDDLANLLPARATAALTVLSAPVVGGSRRQALRSWLRDGRQHPSPNSGQCEAAAAGALGVRLGGRNVYHGRVEERPALGDGRPPGIDDITPRCPALGRGRVGRRRARGRTCPRPTAARQGFPHAPPSRHGRPGAGMSGGLLVAGTGSDAGKSMLTAGICRWLRRQGVRVAPFKAQNMSNNSVVTPDGGEIGRAQALQAQACGLEPSVRFNPVLLKPGSDQQSQVVIRGQAVGRLGAGNFRELRPMLAEAAFAELDALRADYPVVVCEGAGSPTEINLRAGDFVNMGLARHGQLPVIVVGDIDRGGVFAAFFGTVALLDRADQELLAGFVVNKFRGDVGLLRPGLDSLEQLTGRRALGVVPWHPQLWLDTEDSLSSVDGRLIGRPEPPVGKQWLRVAAIRLPRISNATDLEALAAEPGVAVRLTTSPAELHDVDLIVIPGSKSTVDDLEWMRTNGLADAVVAHAQQGGAVLGICGGYQMLGRRIHDTVESGRGSVDGLGLLPVEVTFAREKRLARVAGTALGEPVSGYEIHHGYVTAGDPEPLISTADGSEGAVCGAVAGTHWHGAFESNGFRRAYLRRVADTAGRDFEPAPDTDFGQRREDLLDLLADLVAEHLDTVALRDLVDSGAPRGLPFIPPGAPV